VYEEILDEVEELQKQLPGPEVAEILEQRACDLDRGSPGRAAYLCLAAKQWTLVERLESAQACLEEAVRDGGSADIDPRAELVGVLLARGDKPRVDELLTELRRDVPRDRARGEVHWFVGECLEEHGRLEEALRWFTSGVTRAELDGDIDDISLIGRFRVRRELDLPLDTYDDMAESFRTNYLDQSAVDLEDGVR
jgi:tetratricopeptide (TPR) repeat protein